VILLLLVTGTTVNVMSLMGVMMMIGIVVSDSILIVEFTRDLRRQGPGPDGCPEECLPHSPAPHHDDHLRHAAWARAHGACALEAGSEQYAPLARAIIGGLSLSFVVTLFLVPAAYLLMHRDESAQPTESAA
jgi:HAE1 family hydrophobic/amphiphilic exporter-1